MNTFNPHEEGHAASLQILSAIQERGDPVIVPTLLVPEIARRSRVSQTTASVRSSTPLRPLPCRT